MTIIPHPNAGRKAFSRFLRGFCRDFGRSLVLRREFCGGQARGVDAEVMPADVSVASTRAGNGGVEASRHPRAVTHACLRRATPRCASVTSWSAPDVSTFGWRLRWAPSRLFATPRSSEGQPWPSERQGSGAESQPVASTPMSSPSRKATASSIIRRTSN